MSTDAVKRHGSYETMTDQRRIERARNAGKAAQSPETYAQKLVRDWPAMTAEQKSVVRQMLRPVIKGANG